MKVSHEKKVVRLHMEGSSLSEVIAANPKWWMATAKAKAMAGLVLSLRFVHSFGFVHGYLKAGNVIFDSNHRIQIPTSFTGERRNLKADIRGFVLIVFEIVFGSSPPPLGFDDMEIIIPGRVPKFVSEIIKTEPSLDGDTKRSFNDIFYF
jgi:hypothetical protein